MPVNYSALALGFFLISSPAYAVTSCPADSVIGQTCTQLGATELSSDCTNIAACLYKDATQTALVWKAESSGDNRQWVNTMPLNADQSGYVRTYHVDTWYQNTHAWLIEESILPGGGGCSGTTIAYMSSTASNSVGSGAIYLGNNGGQATMNFDVPPGEFFNVYQNGDNCILVWNELRRAIVINDRDLDSFDNPKRIETISD
jgi:hypothetical protein